MIVNITEHYPENKTLQTKCECGQHAVTSGTVLIVRQRLSTSPVKSFHHLSEETGMYHVKEGQGKKGFTHCVISSTSSDHQICRENWPLPVGTSSCIPEPLHLGYDMIFRWSHVSSLWVWHLRLYASIREDLINRKWEYGLFCQVTP
jgi:hypothetical protein